MYIPIDDIREAVEKTVKKHEERDPYRLCRDLGIDIVYFPLGKYDTAVKGFYTVESRIKQIVINSDLPKIIQRMIIAHELGHAVLGHTKDGTHAFHEFSLFDDTERYEYEANVFAAELLLPDEDVLEVLNDDTSFMTAAARLYVAPEILDFKFRVLKRLGYKLAESPIGARGNFLKDMSISGKRD